MRAAGPGFKAFSALTLQQEGLELLGAANLVMSTGIGGLKPNTLVMMLPEPEVIVGRAVYDHHHNRNHYNHNLNPSRSGLSPMCTRCVHMIHCPRPLSTHWWPGHVHMIKPSAECRSACLPIS